MAVDEKLLALLACPKCKGDLKHAKKPRETLTCHKCRLRYKVENDIPNMLIDEAEKTK